MFKEIQADIRRVYQVDGGGKPSSFGKKIWLLSRSYGFQVIMVHRVYKRCYDASGKPLFFLPAMLCRSLCRILLFLLSKMYDIQIALDTKLGKGLYIGHFGGIRIGPCIIGENCNINHQVEIGVQRNGNDPPSSITIGNNVWIGAHSRLVGAITVGQGATISAGSIVTRDIDDGQLVAGSSGRVIKPHYDNSALLGIHV